MFVTKMMSFYTENDSEINLKDIFMFMNFSLIYHEKRWAVTRSNFLWALLNEFLLITDYVVNLKAGNEL